MPFSPTLTILFAGSLLALQLILAINMRFDLRRWGLKHNFTVSSYTSIVDMLAKYSRIYQPIRVKVNKVLTKPAEVIDDTFAVNRRAAHQFDFYSGYYVLHTLLGHISGHYTWLKWWVNMQKLIYLVQIVALIGAVVLQNSLPGMVSILASLILIGLTIVIETHQETFNKGVLNLAIDLLDLDKNEQTKAPKVVGAFAGYGYWYVAFPFIQIINLFKP
jgi:hypothetical protein